VVDRKVMCVNMYERFPGNDELVMRWKYMLVNCRKDNQNKEIRMPAFGDMMHNFNEGQRFLNSYICKILLPQGCDRTETNN